MNSVYIVCVKLFPFKRNLVDERIRAPFVVYVKAKRETGRSVRIDQTYLAKRMCVLYPESQLRIGSVSLFSCYSCLCGEKETLKEIWDTLYKSVRSKEVYFTQVSRMIIYKQQFQQCQQYFGLTSKLVQNKPQGPLFILCHLSP